MNKHGFTAALLFSMLTTFSSCEVIGGIFKAGMGTGIFVVILVIAIIIFFITRMRKSN